MTTLTESDVKLRKTQVWVELWIPNWSRMTKMTNDLIRVIVNREITGKIPTQIPHQLYEHPNQ